MTEPLDLRNLEPPKPLKTLLEKISALGKGEILRALVPSEPFALYSELNKRGFAYKSERLSDGSWQVEISKPG